MRFCWYGWALSQCFRRVACSDMILVVLSRSVYVSSVLTMSRSNEATKHRYAVEYEYRDNRYRLGNTTVFRTLVCAGRSSVLSNSCTHCCYCCCCCCQEAAFTNRSGSTNIAVSNIPFYMARSTKSTVRRPLIICFFNNHGWWTCSCM